MTSDLMLWLIAAPALGAVVAPSIGAIRPDWRPRLYSLAHLAGLALALVALTEGPASVIVEIQRAPLAVQLGLAVDRGASLALVLTALLLLTIGWFSQEYVRGARHGTAFLSLLLLEQAAVNLVLMAGDLLALYTGLLSLSLALMLMIGLDFGPAGGAAALRVFATLEVPAALAFVGFWLIDARVGTLAFADLARDAGWLRYPDSWALILPIVVALASRAGLAPLQNWVVAGCRAAATPAAIAIVSVALPVGGLVLGRLVGMAIPLGAVWMHGLEIVGAATALVAGVGAWREKSALGWLGYLAIGQVGLAVVGFVAGGPTGQLAGWIALASTSLATALVGMGIGLAIRVAGHGRLDSLGRLSRVRAWPLFFGLLALAPVPPLPTFAARRLLLATLLNGGSEWDRIVAATVLLGTAVLAVPVWRIIFDLVAARAEPDRSPLPSGPMLGLSGLIALLSLAPMPWLIGAVEMGAFTPAPVQDVLATVLILLSVGGVPALGYLVLRQHRPEHLIQLLTLLGRTTRLDLALDPYVVVGGLLLAMGHLSAITLEQTLGRLARAR